MNAQSEIPPQPKKPTRCSWAPADDPLYCAYHDKEWGVPVYDSRALYEKLILDGFQAGLSWRTILYKRDNFIRAFDGFEPEKIARYQKSKIERLLQDKGIIRHRGKIEGAIQNARCYLKMQAAGEDFGPWLWDFVGGKPLHNSWERIEDVPATTPLSEEISKALKQRGFKFCGPTIVYAFMQAVGMVNDHLVSCPRYKVVTKITEGRANI